MTLKRLKSIAGIRIPDTPICGAAIDLLESSSPEFLCQHCVRSFIFGSLALNGLGRKVEDEEAAFCAAILHDLGFVPPYVGDNRYEVDSADAARGFCEQHGVSPERAELVWRAVALHTTAAIPTRMAAEIALSHLGTGMDVLGIGMDQLPKALVEEIVETYPRLDFKRQFTDLLAEHARRNAAAHILTWSDDIVRKAGCTLHGQPIPTASQLVAAAPFGE